MKRKRVPVVKTGKQNDRKSFILSLFYYMMVEGS